MSQNIFLCSETVRPSARWLDAFPEGVCQEQADLVAAVRPGDVVWVEAADGGWLDRLGALVKLLPDCRLVVVSMTPDSAEALAALDRGARGYCHALAVPSMFRDVELVVRHGGLWVGPELMARVVGAAGRALAPQATLQQPLLSEREAEVAREVANGMSNKEIAAKLGITERTVKAHMGAIFEKLGVRDRLQLVLRLSEHRDVSLPVH
ncbi:LuxR family transcriptional regulator [Aromatoleum petrolei]|uniref:DNA-binding response regulator n=1 Tax=Aromatoleum petrolei TaxID=76116 RepID=A0ABX1MSP5_9RHOO|nr:response regulator transcription factor [Aromatoleum petrolei]NMF90950.1 DNA-binding response regulator [Aromatoleum petrolei]QTQ35985.1 Transriptional regulator, LuxR family [Aromatoleum petrolei]